MSKNNTVKSLSNIKWLPKNVNTQKITNIKNNKKTNSFNIIKCTKNVIMII